MSNDLFLLFVTVLYCKHCIWKPQVLELSRFCPETSTKLYVHDRIFYLGLRVLYFWSDYTQKGTYFK
jgi:hypothetical protein